MDVQDKEEKARKVMICKGIPKLDNAEQVFYYMQGK